MALKFKLEVVIEECGPGTESLWRSKLGFIEEVKGQRSGKKTKEVQDPGSWGRVVGMIKHVEHFREVRETREKEDLSIPLGVALVECWNFNFFLL